MSVWEHFVANSTLAEGDGDAWEHLTNPSGTGGEGGLTINSELILVGADNPVNVEFIDDLIGVDEVGTVLIDVEDDIILITEIKIGELDVLC